MCGAGIDVFCVRQLKKIKMVSLLMFVLMLSTIGVPYQATGIRDNAASVTNNYTLSADTGEFEILLGIMARFCYSADLASSHVERIGPGETVSWDVGFSGGLINVSVYEPFITKKWYSVVEDVPIGESVEIPIFNVPPVYINVIVLVVANASLNVTGPGSLSTTSLNWDFEGYREFNVTANTEAEEGEAITVAMNFSYGISGSINIKIYGQENEFPIVNVFYPASPVVTESITIAISIPPTSDFSLTVDTNSVTFKKPFFIKIGNLTITVSSIGNFSSTVELSIMWIGSQPNGIIPLLDPKTVTPSTEGSANSTLTFIVFFFTPRGTYTLLVTGQSEELTHTVHITITVS